MRVRTFNCSFFIFSVLMASLPLHASEKKCSTDGVSIQLIDIQRHDLWGAKNVPIGKFSVKNVTSKVVSVPISGKKGMPFVFQRSFDWQVEKEGNWKNAYTILEEVLPPDGMAVIEANGEEFVFVDMYQVVNDPRAKQGEDRKVRLVVRDSNGCAHTSAPFDASATN